MTDVAESIGIKITDGRIDTIGLGRTSVEHIYAIGDITAGPQLAHKASAEGENAVMSILDDNSIIWPDLIPACVYTSPEIACVGAQLMCANATDMIGELTLAISQGITTIEDCASVMRAHPTYEECVGEAFRLLEQKLGES